VRNGYDRLTFVPWGKINPFYEAVVQATEEAVANALIANEDMTGRDGHRSPALPRRRPRRAPGREERQLLKQLPPERDRSQRDSVNVT